MRHLLAAAYVGLLVWFALAGAEVLARELAGWFAGEESTGVDSGAE